jgi:hypothetical protein
MKHAGPATLMTLETLLERLRLLSGLAEKKPGIFYLKSKAYLHFHEGPAGIFADVRLAGDDFERFAVNTCQEQAALLERLQLPRQSSRSI